MCDSRRLEIGPSVGGEGERERERTNLKEGKRVRCPHFAVAEEMRYFDADAGAFQVFAVTFYYKVNH